MVLFSTLDNSSWYFQTGWLTNGWSLYQLGSVKKSPKSEAPVFSLENSCICHDSFLEYFFVTPKSLSTSALSGGLLFLPHKAEKIHCYIEEFCWCQDPEKVSVGTEVLLLCLTGFYTSLPLSPLSHLPLPLIIGLNITLVLVLNQHGNMVSCLLIIFPFPRSLGCKFWFSGPASSPKPGNSGELTVSVSKCQGISEVDTVLK